MVLIRRKVGREFILGVTVPNGGQETREFQSLKEMDVWLDSEFRGYPVGSQAFHGGERYEVLPGTESVPEPWQRRAAFTRKVGLAFLAGGGFWLVVGLILASRGGLHILGKAGLSLAYLGGVLYGAAWMAGRHPLSTAAIEKRVAKWVDGVARTAWLRWRWTTPLSDHPSLRRWRDVEAVIDCGRSREGVRTWTWAAWVWNSGGNCQSDQAPSRRQAMRAAEEWIWSQAREARR